MRNTTMRHIHFWLPEFSGRPWSECSCGALKLDGELSQDDRDQLYEIRKQWVESRGMHLWQIEEDENGEHIEYEAESGGPGDDYQIETKREYLPDALSHDVIFKKH